MALYSIEVQGVFSGVAYPRTWGLFNFSRVPKLFGPISGATIPFISSQRRGSRLSNFAIVLGFLILKTSAFSYNKKISFSKQADCSLTTSFSGPKSSGDFRETGPWFLFKVHSVNIAERRKVYKSLLNTPLNLILKRCRSKSSGSVLFHLSIFLLVSFLLR